jgi:DnaJ-class molecular chaperone
MAKDLYDLLNLRADATASEIKKSYRKLAFQCHPDKNKSEKAQHQFHEISEAYQILSNPQRRKRYDQFGYDTVSESNAPPIDPMELFSRIFNVDFGQQMNQNVFFFSDLSPLGMLNEVPTNSLLYTLDLTLDELYSGTQKEFTVDSKNEVGIFKSTKYVVNIKAGTKDKEHLVVNAGGHYNPLLRSYDNLLIQIKELPHVTYTRQEDDLVRECQISLGDALCGTEITLDHFGQPVKVQISDIVKPNSVYQIWGQGMPIKAPPENALGSGSHEGHDQQTQERGNLLLDLTIDFPAYLSEKHKDYLRQLLTSETQGDTGDKETTEDTGDKEECMVLQAYYYKNKEDVMKELLNEETQEGCMVQ